jgi:hypothetical protein
VEVTEATVHLHPEVLTLIHHLLLREAALPLTLAVQGDDEKNSSTGSAFFDLG